MPDPSIYTVGWICAIKPEYVAAQAFLDERHDRTDHVNAADANVYTLGILGKHNVVIGTLPDGEYGIAAAVGVAKAMRSSFPNVRIGLMVGIGGGAPSSKNDIRLGDVVVSAPRNGHGGVFQYDMGKTIQNKRFQTIGFLNQPPELLRAALTDIQAEHELYGHQLEEAINTALAQKPRLQNNYRRPSSSSDRLFRSEIVHQELDGIDCMTDCYVGSSSLVERRERTSEEDNPAIHYGTIASANQLMKDAVFRDQLAEEEGVLCFEMEAAGLMNRFPCVVIRGICDYADSHKNKQWQGYAAMAAAAYAKDFLRRIPATRLETERQISTVLGFIGTGIKSIQSTATKVQGKLQGLHESVVTAHQRAVLDRLSIAKGATFDSSSDEHRSTCLASTRVEALEEIQNWADDSSAEPMFWLNGMAGTGKSTISRTVAQSWASQGRLGASFFFKRGETDRASIAKFFPTIASDLVHRLPAITRHVSNALDADALLCTRNTREQFSQLFLKPLSKVENGSTDAPTVFIIDALDECEQETDISLLLRLFFRASTELARPIKIFITSRPELTVRVEFTQRAHQNIILHEIPRPLIKRDMFLFFEHRLAEIRTEFNASVADHRKLRPDWPGRDALESLTTMSVPLFIFAATLCLFIADRRCGNPETQLLKVVSHQATKRRASLNSMYLLVLGQQIASLDRDEEHYVLQRFREIVGPLVLLSSPFSAAALSRLLEIPQRAVDDCLDPLHSVIRVPDWSIDAPIRLLHLSFGEFLVDAKGRDSNPFWIDEKETHTGLSARCLCLLSHLKKDICATGLPGTPRTDISSERVNSCLPSEVQYACLYWVHHLNEASSPISNGTDAHRFLIHHFLHWIEALALMGRASDSLGLLRALQSRITGDASTEISSFLDDALRFLQSFMSVISSTPLQLYSSLLIFAPNQSKVRSIFEKSQDAATWVCLKPRMNEYWDNCLQTLEGHSLAVSSVAFSHDSMLVASGSKDRTVRIWRADTGACVQILEGHSDPVSSVAFSHDSTLVASGSYDNTVRIWRANVGECVRTLQGHDGVAVLSIAFSHDSELMAVGSGDDKIRIWRVHTGECVQTLKEDCGAPVLSVDFSHDSAFVVSGSYDDLLHIWRTATGECLQILHGHTKPVLSVALSNDSRLVASGSGDETVRIWHVGTAKCVQILEGHNNPVWSVAWSHDATLVASGSGDDTIRISDTKTGECVQTLKGHRGPVLSVAFSHDSTLVASGSGDNTIRIWRAADGYRCAQAPEGHSELVSSVAFSHDSALVASGSDDDTIRIWCASTGKCLNTLRGHRNPVFFVTFSHDSTLLASGSDDETVRLWRTGTGECVQMLKGHSSAILSVAFSHDSTLVAAGSDAGTVRVWLADTGECVRTLQCHGRNRVAVAFSHDSTLIASSGNKSVYIWRADTGKYVQTLDGLGGSVFSVAFSHDAKLVASSSGDKTLRIWRADTCECVRTIYIGCISERLEFIQDGSCCILTDVGAITIDDNCLEDSARCVQRPGIGIDKDWILWDGSRLLWLPVQFRATCSAVSGSTIVIGSSSGKVIILRLSLNCL